MLASALTHPRISTFGLQRVLVQGNLEQEIVFGSTFMHLEKEVIFYLVERCLSVRFVSIASIRIQLVSMSAPTT